MQARRRLYVAIQSPETVLALVTTLQNALRESVRPVRWVPPGTAHITLQFLGSVPEEYLEPLAGALGKALAGARPLELATAGLGTFPGAARPRVLWLGVTGPGGTLTALQAVVAGATAALGFEADEAPFRAHVTLGRVDRTATDAQRRTIGRLVAATPPPPVTRWRAGAVTLMESRLDESGARHARLAEWLLAGGGD